MLGMVEGLLHEPGERLRALRADAFTDEFNERRIQLENVERPTLNVQSRNTEMPIKPGGH
jgi:hypothetical protein